MKYCITGAAGNISKLLARHLLKANQQVRVIGRKKEHLSELVELGAETAIGSVEDVDFLKQCFAGVDAAYTMCPPNFSPEGYVAFAEKIGKNYKEALTANKINYVVNLSSVGAHLTEGTGQITGLHKIEHQLNEIPKANILHLRPVYFYTNFFSQVGMIRNLEIMGSNFSFEATGFPLVHPSDIAFAAALKLQSLDFSGINVEYLASDQRSTNDIAAVLGNAVGKPDLKWIKFSDEQMFDALLQSGLHARPAKELVEGFHAIDTGKVFEEYLKMPTQLKKLKLEEFAEEFAAIYSANAASKATV